MYLSLIEMGIGFLTQFLAGLKVAKAPQEVLTALQSALDSLNTHKYDIINKSNLDALRG